SAFPDAPPASLLGSVQPSVEKKTTFKERPACKWGVEKRLQSRPWKEGCSTSCSLQDIDGCITKARDLQTQSKKDKLRLKHLKDELSELGSGPSDYDITKTREFLKELILRLE